MIRRNSIIKLMSNNAMQRLSIPKISSICSKNCQHRLDSESKCTNLSKNIFSQREKENQKLFTLKNSQNQNENKNFLNLKFNNTLLKTSQEIKQVKEVNDVNKDPGSGFKKFKFKEPLYKKLTTFNNRQEQTNNQNSQNNIISTLTSTSISNENKNLLAQSCQLKSNKNIQFLKLNGSTTNSILNNITNDNQPITTTNATNTFLKKKIDFQEIKKPNEIPKANDDSKTSRPPINPLLKTYTHSNFHLLKKEMLKKERLKTSKNNNISVEFSSPFTSKLSSDSSASISRKSRSSDKVLNNSQPSQENESTLFLNKKQKIEENNHQLRNKNETHENSEKDKNEQSVHKSQTNTQNIIVSNQFSISFDNISKYDFDHLQTNIKQIDIEKYTSTNEQNQKTNEDNVPTFTQEEYRCYLSYVVKKTLLPSVFDHFFSEEVYYSNCLTNHKVTERMRTRMVDWMIEVLSNFKSDDNTFFLAVNVMDAYFKSTKNKLPEELHLIGVTSMFIASKYQDLIPLRLNIVEEKISHGNLQSSQIKEKEEDILSKIDYTLGKPTIWEFITMFYEIIYLNKRNGFSIKNSHLKSLIDKKELCFENDFNLKYEYDAISYYSENFLILVKHVLIYLAKMNCHDFKLNDSKPSLIAASTIYVTMKICGHINSEEYINLEFKKILCGLSRATENEIRRCSQIVLTNAQNFDKNFPDIHNLKKIHFSNILAIQNTR